MAKIIPFKAVRTRSDKVSLVTTRAVFTYGTRELNSVLDYNPYSFLQIINPERQEKTKTRPNTLERFLRVKGKYEFFMKENVLITEEKPSLYIYEQQKKNGEKYIGFIGAGSVEDYANGVIRPHEETLTKREKTFKEYLDVCQFNAEPVLLTYPHNPVLSSFIKDYRNESKSIFNFATQDGNSHKVWKIENPEDIQKVSSIFEEFNAIYIADGHHRMASSHLYATSGTPVNNSSLFMAYFIDESQLLIHGFNRVVRDLNGLSKQVFLDKLSDKFTVTEINRSQANPQTEGKITMYLESQWYELHFKEPKPQDPVKRLDASILNTRILEPILNIYDLRNDKRISFVGGENKVGEIEELVNKNKMKVAFCLHPIGLKDLKNVSDAKEFMPPKTSWIEPKLRSGMLILDYNRS